MKKLQRAILLGFVVSTLAVSTQSIRADNRNLIPQSTSTDCGPAALATLLNFYLGIPTTEREMERLSGANKAIGTTLLGLQRAAEAKGCAADSFRMNYQTLQKQLKTFASPLIVNLMNQEPHFALVLEAGDEYVFLADPAFGNIVLRKEDFLRHWTFPVARVTENTSVSSTPANTSSASTPDGRNAIENAPPPEGFVFIAVSSDAEAGRDLRREMVSGLQKQITNVRTARPPIAVFRR